MAINVRRGKIIKNVCKDPKGIPITLRDVDQYLNIYILRGPFIYSHRNLLRSGWMPILIIRVERPIQATKNVNTSLIPLKKGL